MAMPIKKGAERCWCLWPHRSDI